LRVTEDPYRYFVKKMAKTQEKQTEELLAQSKTLGRIFQNRRLTKKVSTGIEYLTEDH
jgi:hypothetical protein